jgi:hypothetical protein
MQEHAQRVLSARSGCSGLECLVSGGPSPQLMALRLAAVRAGWRNGGAVLGDVVWREVSDGSCEQPSSTIALVTSEGLDAGQPIDG